MQGTKTLCGAWWTSPKGIDVKLSGDGLTTLQGKTIPWGDIPNLEGFLSGLFHNGGKDLRVSPTVTKSWVADQIRAAKEAGESIEAEIAVAKWYFYNDMSLLAEFVTKKPPDRVRVNPAPAMQKPEKPITMAPDGPPDSPPDDAWQADPDVAYLAMREAEEAPPF